jgi:mannose-6-phosphate isomerase-like protein (cupin superfamily)
MNQPIIVSAGPLRPADQPPISAIGQSFEIHEWSGSGPNTQHIHHSDDEAWHVLEGTLTFRFGEQTLKAPAGTTVFVPAGVPHTYFEADGPTRYLIIMPPRLGELIAALHNAPVTEHGAIMRHYDSELVE